ncbi:MAG: hypothetical protein IKR18_06735 [Bacteroidaceae bacterium]|nr:hypothetical protein [Bacteroidaceae bacterium]
MKKLLFIMLLLSLPVAYSCNKGGDEVEKKEKPTYKQEVNDSDSSYSFVEIPAVNRMLRMSNGTAVDTLYFEPGEYITGLGGFSIFDRARRYPPFCQIDFDERKDTLLRYGDSIIGEVKYRDYVVSRIELYNWFTISEIYVVNKRAYEARSTGTNPNGMLFTLMAVGLHRGDSFTIH